MAGSPWTNQVVSLIILTEETTGFSGLFGYSPTAGAGNLIFSLAAGAGTDPYGNTYPQGLSTTLGAISGTTFSGTDFVINSFGIFLYSGPPSAGNLVNSITNFGGTDPYGNHYLTGSASYGSSNGQAVANVDGVLFFYTGSLAAGWTPQGSIQADTTNPDQIDTEGNALISGNLIVQGTALTVNGTNIIATLSGQPTTTNGLPNGGIAGTSGSASAGTAHTHGPGSYSVTDGQHSHDLPAI